MPPAAIAIASLAVATVGTGYSIYKNERAAKQQKIAQRAQQSQNDLQAARQKREAVRAARLAQASLAASSENSGTSYASGSQGGLSSITSQLNSNLSFLDQYGMFSDTATRALGKAQSNQASAETASAIAGFGMTVFNNRDQVSKIFKGN